MRHVAAVLLTAACAVSPAFAEETPRPSNSLTAVPAARALRALRFVETTPGDAFRPPRPQPQIQRHLQPRTPDDAPPSAVTRISPVPPAPRYCGMSVLPAPAEQDARMPIAKPDARDSFSARLIAPERCARPDAAASSSPASPPIVAPPFSAAPAVPAAPGVPDAPDVRVPPPDVSKRP